MRARRLAAQLLAAAAALALPAACGRDAGFPNTGMCQTVAWGGWNGSPDCAGIAASVIAAEHRTCNQDADCAIVGASSCSAHAVNLGAADSYRAYPPPCGHPLAGMCPPALWRAVCQQGCCVPLH